jgi:arsenate reductase (thioredoxin)
MLFVSRLNTGASLMAEAILRHLAQGRVRAASAGESVTVAHAHPAALQCLRAHHVSTVGLRSKVWGAFFGLAKPPVRILIALEPVYASAASWPSDTIIANWNTPDPAALDACEIDTQVAFEETYGALYARIGQFLSLQWEHMEGVALSKTLGAIGEQ